MAAIRMGVRGRLLLAIGAISLLPVVAATVSWRAFRAIEDSIEAVIARELPRIETSLNLARQADRVVLAGATLADTQRAEVVAAQQKILDAEAARADELLEELQKGDAGDDRTVAIRAALGELRQ